MTVNDSLRFNAKLRRQLRFYLTSAAPCPYLPGKQERKVFTNLAVEDADGLHDTLTHHGFRRSQTIAYRPACTTCRACLPVRIPVADFEFTKSRRRILNKNNHLKRSPQPSRPTRQQFQLLKTYLSDRHHGGGMSDMSFSDYAAMVGESPISTAVFEYREGDDDSPLRAAAITDVLRDGLSMVYTYFDPDEAINSPGSFLILDHIQIARELDIPYVYLGYWVKGSQKMDYKSRFQPLEVLIGKDWIPFDRLEGEIDEPKHVRSA